MVLKDDLGTHVTMSTSMKRHNPFFLVFLIVSGFWGVTIVAEASMVVAAMVDPCAQHLYATDCLSVPRCHWCCEAAFGHQCFSATETSGTDPIIDETSISHSLSAVCAAEATLSYKGQTCEGLCREMGTACDACVRKSWCYFCVKSGLCQAPFDVCPHNSISRTCTPAAPEQSVGALWKTLRVVVVALFAAAAIPPMGYGGWQLARYLLRAFRRCRRRRAARAERRQAVQAPQTAGDTDAAPPRTDGLSADPAVPPPAGSANTAPALSSRSSAVLDDENVCYLCLAARPSVTFLPCYHTCCCEACSNRLRPVHGAITCPFCRRRVEAMVSLPRLLQPTERSGRGQVVTRVHSQGTGCAALPH